MPRTDRRAPLVRARPAAPQRNCLVPRRSAAQLSGVARGAPRGAARELRRRATGCPRCLRVECAVPGERASTAPNHGGEHTKASGARKNAHGCAEMIMRQHLAAALLATTAHALAPITRRHAAAAATATVVAAPPRARAADGVYTSNDGTYSFATPEGFEPKPKPVRTHADEVLYERPGRNRSEQRSRRGAETSRGPAARDVDSLGRLRSRPARGAQVQGREPTRDRSRRRPRDHRAAPAWKRTGAAAAAALLRGRVATPPRRRHSFVAGSRERRGGGTPSWPGRGNAAAEAPSRFVRICGHGRRILGSRASVAVEDHGRGRGDAAAEGILGSRAPVAGLRRRGAGRDPRENSSAGTGRARRLRHAGFRGREGRRVGAEPRRRHGRVPEKLARRREGGADVLRARARGRAAAKRVVAAAARRRNNSVRRGTSVQTLQKTSELGKRPQVRQRVVARRLSFPVARRRRGRPALRHDAQGARGRRGRGGRPRGGRRVVPGRVITRSSSCFFSRGIRSSKLLVRVAAPPRLRRG